MSPRHLPVSRRVTVGVGALLCALLLALVPLPSGADRAQAAEADAEDSAMTLTGTKGPYDDFSELKVTVQQTRNLRAQGVEVSWTGFGTPPPNGYQNFVQIMQCWGDDPAGPDREQCEFGANAAGSRWLSQRALPRNTDPLETEYTSAPSGNPFVPFRPVSGDPTDSAVDWTYFSPNDSNTQPWLRSRTDGGGSAVFEVKTALEAPYLGCGAVESAGDPPRRCWLVVVPRGKTDPDGTVNPSTGVSTSALSQSNWNQRLVFPLDFGPVGNSCPADMAERRLSGSELLTDAITSWQSELCKGADARFTFSQLGEDYTRNLMRNPTSTSPGMGITVAPLEDEEPQAVHAPVAVSGIAVGFFWEDEGNGGQPIPELRLSARLLAKLLTGSYPYDIRHLNFTNPVPDHLQGNARSIVVDPEFRELNPVLDRQVAPQLNPGGIIVQAGNSDVNALVWSYLQSDTDAREFLAGKPDPWGMKVNPYYLELELDRIAPLDFPKADPTETRASLVVNGEEKSLPYGQLEKSPYSNDMHDGAVRVRRGATGATFVPALDTASPEGMKLVTSAVLPGSRMAYGVVDTASAARYRLDVAALPNADGTYVKPTTDSLLKAVSLMPDSAVEGVKAPTPATAKDGAYPLTAVAYAVAPLDQPADARRDYARLIRYAVGGGQTAGLAPGELPPGYAPLPKALRDQALAAADRLVRGKAAGPAVTPPPDGGAGGVGGVGGGGIAVNDSADGPGPGIPAGAAAAGGAAGAGSGAGGAPETPDAPDASAGPGAPGAGTGGPAPEEGNGLASSGGPTPGEVLGIVRWVLLGVLVAGGAAALAGPVLLRLSVRRTATGGPA